jgi:2C-methyl-D-erythritol 2,4-cyclodiphosphate synthase
LINNHADEDEESEEHVEAAKKKHEEQLQKANATITGMLESPKLKPYKKKMREILADEVAEHGLQNSVSLAVRGRLSG